MSRQRPRRSWAPHASKSVGELVDRTSDRPACARGVLQQQPRRVRAELESLLQRRHAPFHADLHARAEVRADVEDDAVRVDRARDLHRVAQRGARLLVELVVGSSKVDEVERVREHASGRDAELRAPLLERFEVGRVVVRRPPHARALREQLHRVRLHRLCPLERVVDAARGRTRGRRRTRNYDRPRSWPSAFAWRRRRPGSSTSGRRARFSSTGSSRASTRASACCASRTPT